MKKIRFWSMMMLAAMVMPVLSSCGGSDDDSPGNGANTADDQLKASIEGVWKRTTGSESNQNTIYVFKADGKTWQGSLGSYAKWSVKDGKLLMEKNRDGRIETWNVVIVDDKMYLSFKDISMKDGKVIDASESEVLVRVTDLVLPTLNKSYFIGYWGWMLSDGKTCTTQIKADGTVEVENINPSIWNPDRMTPNKYNWDYNSLYITIGGQRYLIISATENEFVTSDYWPVKTGAIYKWTRRN